MKKLMILGASYSQLPLYKTAKKLGIATVAVSTPGDCPALTLQMSVLIQIFLTRRQF